MTEPIHHPERITAELRPRAPRLKRVTIIPTWYVVAVLVAFIIAFTLAARIQP